ncbi:DUF6174 domain-containing protein [Streptomyces sp. PmtG]
MTTAHPARTRSLAFAVLAAGALCALSACGDESSGSGAANAKPLPATHQSEKAWKEPSSYVYTLTSGQGERSLIGRFRVTVRNGEVTKAVGLDDSGRRVVKKLPRHVPTIGELLEEMRQARRDDADTAKATYAQDGHPVRIVLDHDKDALDDEALYEISDYRPATA